MLVVVVVVELFQVYLNIPCCMYKFMAQITLQDILG